MKKRRFRSRAIAPGAATVTVRGMPWARVVTFQQYSNTINGFASAPHKLVGLEISSFSGSGFPASRRQQSRYRLLTATLASRTVILFFSFLFFSGARIPPQYCTVLRDGLLTQTRSATATWNQTNARLSSTAADGFCLLQPPKKKEARPWSTRAVAAHPFRLPVWSRRHVFVLPRSSGSTQLTGPQNSWRDSQSWKRQKVSSVQVTGEGILQ
ncbi:hypothetical protein BCV70DRAFT_68689 [Testicularia cyperi]|uniref:Uncharacterized protein n=1 Tax=Testicularia cyperi TaxID=1882483 RepID=A0A317XG52_9BASI|nr:hypothetical protein BCV70DRAFT_68689 [Testicularia cyperi]